MSKGSIVFQNQFYDICRKKKNKTAITYIKKDSSFIETSYEQMKNRVVSIIKRYKEIGVTCGDRVAVLIPLSDSVYLDIIALACMGATSVILDINLHKSELLRIINDSDVSCIITTECIFNDKLQENNLPVIECSDSGLLLRNKMIDHARDPNYDAMTILYSSGTTSNSKGVVIGYEQEINSFNRLYNVIGSDNVKYLMLFPTSHISGLTSFLVVLMRGGSLAILEESSATQLQKGFQIYKPNCFGMVPKIWDTYKNKIEESIEQKGVLRAKSIKGLILLCGKIRHYTGINIGKLLFHSINKQVFGGKLVQMYSGGGKLNPETSRFFWNIGYDFFDFYASTEANIPIVVTNGIKYMSSLGKINDDPNTIIRIWNPDANGVGEIQIKSNMMMLGYFRSVDLTCKAYEGEFFKTGDYGRIDNNELYLTGRIKESIHLPNGEKVSPEDIENSYREIADHNIDFAVAGIRTNDGYDEVYVFAVGQHGQYDELFYRIKQSVNDNFRYKKLIYVDSLPKTSVGKVKRYLLSTFADEENNSEDSEETFENNLGENVNIEEWLYKALKKYTDSEITKDKKIYEELGIDSLSIFELCVDIDNFFDVCIENSLGKDLTVSELAEIISNQNEDTQNEEFDYNAFPLKRTKKDWNRFKAFDKWTRKNYDYSCSGLENIDSNENYIFTPNHESHFDSMWMMNFLPREMQERICSMAADYLFRKSIYKQGVRIMGGIPVHRSGNTSTAMKRIYDLMTNDNASLMIHPEGTRTRDGKLGTFKTGAAELSIKTGVKIVPVGIIGAREVFPPNKMFPIMKKIGAGKKKLHIAFGKPLDPRNFSNAEEMTEEIRNEIIKLKRIG